MQKPLVSSVIIQGWAKLAVYAMIAVAIYLFFRGHNAPGGGFVAGIITAIALLFWYAIGYYNPKNSIAIAALGLLIAYSTALIPAAFGQAALTHTMFHIGPIHIGTAAVFDLGVYFVVVGISVTIMQAFSRS